MRPGYNQGNRSGRDGRTFADDYNAILDGEFPADAFRRDQGWPGLRQWAMGIVAGPSIRRFEKALSAKYEEIMDKIEGAGESMALIDAVVDALKEGDDEYRGIRDREGVTFTFLRDFCQRCEPIQAIIQKRVDQVSAFAQPTNTIWGRAENPGFRIRMTNKREKATEYDLKQMAMLEVYIQNCGFVDPPKDERPVGWEPGFSAFLKQIVRDSLTLDWVAVRTWEPVNEGQKDRFPVVAFAAEDSARVRIKPRKILGSKDGKLQTAPAASDRTNTDEEKVYALFDQEDGRPIADYTDSEMFTWKRNPRTDRLSRGYGYPESERIIEVGTNWCNSLQYNSDRFKKDALPRGFLTLMANVSQNQLRDFNMQWTQMLQGVRNRWAIPTLVAAPGVDGKPAGALWTPMDLSSRDMEYKEFMFMLAALAHAAYNIHPEETGYQAFSPYRPPLSEASPESRLKYSQDTGLETLMTSLATMLNRGIIWKLFPSRRYSIEFLGLGEYDGLVDAQESMARLQAGTSTPRMEWDARDMEIPAFLRDHPAWDIPAPWLAGANFVMQVDQMNLQTEQMKLQMMQMERQNAMMQLQARTASLVGGPAAGGGGAGPGGQMGQPAMGQGGPMAALPPPGGMSGAGMGGAPGAGGMPGLDQGVGGAGVPGMPGMDAPVEVEQEAGPEVPDAVPGILSQMGR